MAVFSCKVRAASPLWGQAPLIERDLPRYNSTLLGFQQRTVLTVVFPFIITDSEEEMEEGESGVTQRSPSGTSSPGSSRQAAGSKEEKDSNQLEKPSSWRLGSGEEEELEGSPGVSTEAGGRPESNDKHNMKERLRFVTKGSCRYAS